jgi:uncharacterized protein YyaL (SSP411 family)
MSFTNRLSRESSPYLLQHAHNPVDWYPWGEEAFDKAKKEDKPVLVSIGYAACHWCHVMERESFENPEVAALMNENFVNIKVDREERPDVDHTYMDALQAMEGSGGWPLNVFLTPERKPFYGGTYFPPKRAFNRASWPEVLESIARAYRENRDQVEQQAQNLTEHLKVSNSFGLTVGKDHMPGAAKIDDAFENIMKAADRDWGGFGSAPKFPQTFTIHFLLQYAHLKKNETARQQALLSLDRMIRGGIYDQIGGGFARYATDKEWLVPHFEKMLYDNALLVALLSDAFRQTKNEEYLTVIRETLAFVERELMHTEGGFFSALDADSEGEEGRFYVWDHEEVKQVLGEDAKVFSAYFDITPGGNWEGRSIARIVRPLKQFSEEQGMEEEELRRIIERGKAKLLQKRDERVRPLLDDKVLLGWNALMNLAYSKAFAATGDRHYRELARRNMAFMLRAFNDEKGLLHHSWKDGKAKHPAFLDDYAFMIAALVELGEVSSEFSYLDQAKDLTEKVLENFSDEASSFFFYTHQGQEDVLVRKKEIYDGATPSGNSVMALNLYRLSIVYDRPEWRERAEAMVASIGEAVTKYPTSFGLWLSLAYEMAGGTAEIAIIGRDWENYLEKLLSIYIPHRLVMASARPNPGYPLLADKPGKEETLLYLCKNYACRPAVATIEGFLSLMKVK